MDKAKLEAIKTWQVHPAKKSAYGREVRDLVQMVTLR